jgi:transposase
MGTPQREPLRELAETEVAALRRIVQASSERVDRVRRARALLTVAAGASCAAAAQDAGLRSRTTVANLVARFNRQGLAALSIASGRGRKSTYDAKARAQIVAIAQTAPDRKADGTATWSLSTLQKRLRKEGLEQIGTNTETGPDAHPVGRHDEKLVKPVCYRATGCKQACTRARSAWCRPRPGPRRREDAQRIAHAHVGVSVREGGTGNAAGLVWDGIDRLGMQAHGRLLARVNNLIRPQDSSAAEAATDSQRPIRQRYQAFRRRPPHGTVQRRVLLEQFAQV